MTERSAKTLVAVFTLAFGLLAAAVPAWAALSATPDNVPQTNGIVTAVLVVGDRVYIGGNFTQVGGAVRNNLAAVDANGNLTGWAPSADGRVLTLAASPDGKRIYAGGSFTSINGVARRRLAAIDAATGAVDSRWRPRANSSVRALAVSGRGVYIGGDFTLISGQSRARLALVDDATGAVISTWAPAASDRVRALGLSADGNRLYAGGGFTAISGQARQRLAAIDAATGALDPWRANPSPNGPVYDLDLSGGRLYAAEGGPGGVAASYDLTSGGRAWRLPGDGDVQAITVIGGTVYFGGHFLRVGGQERRFFAAADVATGGLDPGWLPRGSGSRLTTTVETGVWALAPDASGMRLYAGTNFPRVSGLVRQGFVRFSDTGA